MSAFIEIEHRGRMLRRFWTKPGLTQHQIRQQVSDAMRGGFTLHVTLVRENRAHLSSHRIEVPWGNKDLEIKWEHFTSKLEPNQKETWTAVIESRQPKSAGGRVEKAVAELVATLYDESLDAFRPNRWMRKFDFFRHDDARRSANFCNTAKHLQHLRGSWITDYRDATWRYREFPKDLVANFWGYGWGWNRGGVRFWCNRREDGDLLWRGFPLPSEQVWR